jgi:hypothetical protein
MAASGRFSLTFMYPDGEVDLGHSYKLLRVYRTLVLGHDVDPRLLEGVSAENIDIAVRRGVRNVKQVLADLRELTLKHLLERYRDEGLPAQPCHTSGQALPRTGVAAKSQKRRYPLLDDAEWLRERYLERGDDAGGDRGRAGVLAADSQRGAAPARHPDAAIDPASGVASPFEPSQDA